MSMCTNLITVFNVQPLIFFYDILILEKSESHLETPLEERVAELRHRLRIEAAVVEGAKNVIRTLQSSKIAEKKALQEVSILKLYINLQCVEKQII